MVRSNTPCIAALLAWILSTAAPRASALAAPAPEFLGHAIEQAAEDTSTVAQPSPPVSSQTYTNGQIAGLSVDTANRTDVADFFHCVYMASEGFESRMNWSGDIANCDAGTVSTAFHDDTLRRINYYRAMVGVANVTLNPAKNAKCQEAALIMSRNGGLSHSPTNEHPDWFCLSADGHEAAEHSNLGMSTGPDYTGPRGIDGQMIDTGDWNKPVGHRRWLLYRRSAEMGNGGNPGDGPYGSAGAVWVVGDFAPAPPTPAWTAWPNAGYIPYPVAPARWSFSMPSANFDNATVTMSLDGIPITLTKVHPTVSSPAGNYGDPTIVWEPDDVDLGPPAADTPYTVTIANIADGSATSVTYTVTIMDPYVVEEDARIAGPSQPLATLTTMYSFAPVSNALAYHVRIREIRDTDWLEGAEDAPPPRIIDETDGDYALVQGTVVRTGAKAFHLAFSSPADQRFEIDRTLIASTNSTLTFAFRRRFCTVYNVLTAEVSTDDGAMWSTAWSTNGIDEDWDPSWIPVEVSLASYAGQPIRVRFSFTVNYTYYPAAGTDYGVFVDDVTVTHAGEELATVITDLSADQTHFTVTPSNVTTYIMDLSVETACHTYGYGTDTSVTSAPAIRINDLQRISNNVIVGFSVDGGTCATYRLNRKFDLDQSWLTDSQAVLNAVLKQFTTGDTNQPLHFYRVQGGL